MSQDSSVAAGTTGFGSGELEAAVLRHLSASSSGPVVAKRVATRDLKVGEDSARVRRLDVRVVAGATGTEHVESFVQKYAVPAEHEAMQLLESLGGDACLPRLLGSGEDDFGSWILTPYIHGDAHRDFSLPPEIVQTLARVHSHFQDASDTLASLPRVDEEFWEHCLARIEEAAAARLSGSEESRVSLQDGILALRDAAHVVDAALCLPATLLHGDVHPGNIIHRADDDLAVLFDWGNARVGPAGFDLTNCIPSAAQPEWALYWEHVEASTGSPVDETQRSTQFQVGRILTQVQYLPFAIEHGSLARAAEMMDLALADSRVLRAWRG